MKIIFLARNRNDGGKMSRKVDLLSKNIINIVHMSNGNKKKINKKFLNFI